MATFLYKTRGISSPEHKPRVFFTCHPDDFEKHFKKICEDIFKTHDCAIFYTEDLNEEIEEKYKESDLGQMNLFVIPVTFKLLSKPNRAMDSDFRYAQEKHIPVLPIMMEPGMDKLYAQEDKFGELQYLDPYSHDLTAISYEEKLKKYLESVLISNEMAERIRKAFDAYIFLSYRKKDRHYANELMKMIHSHPEFRDIAIWYDEFLTPGESFRENIERLMKDSKLFALLVTPNLLEYVDGKPNFVMEHEYPDAKKAGMDILPTEMEVTDKDELRSKFEGIPDCVNPDEEVFKKRLADTLSKIAVFKNNDDPEHDFLIGLAYFDGIDMEVDYNKAIKLITDAANKGLVEAQKKLVYIYTSGKGVEINTSEAINWQKKVVNCLSHKADGINDEENIHAYLDQELILGELQRSIGDLKAARNTCWRVLKNCKNDGRYGLLFSEGRRIYFVHAYILLGDVFKDREDYDQAEECYEKAVKEIENGFDCKQFPPVFLDIIGKAYLKLGQLHLIPDHVVLLERIEEYFEKSIDAFKTLCDMEYTKENAKNVIKGYTALCNLYLEYFGLSRKEALVKANQATLNLFENMCVWAPEDNQGVEYYEILLTKGDIQQKYDNEELALETYQYTLNVLEFIPEHLRTVAINDCICRAQIKIADIFRSKSNRTECERYCFSALELIIKLHQETGRKIFLSYMAETKYILSSYYASSGRDAFEILLHLHNETASYDEQLFHVKRNLWERKILCEKDFPFKHLRLADKNICSNVFFDEEAKKYEIDIVFVTSCPKKKIIGLQLCALTLVENNYVRTNTHTMRIQLAKIGSSGCRFNPTPDEFITCFFEDGTSEKYQRCYG